MTIAEINPGVAVANGVVHFQLISGNRVAIEDARWPFAMGALRLEPTTLDFSGEAARRLTFRVDALDAAAFIQQLDFPNLAATGRFDGALPMIFDDRGGRIEGGSLVARKDGGTLAYVGELSSAQLGTMGKLAFDALKAIRYSSLQIRFDGRLDGEMISQVNFTGVREATPDQALIARMIRNLPFRFNIRIRAPFRGLVGSARAYMDPRLLLTQPPTTPAEPAVQSVVSEPVR
nr:YdbH domain-containing protein [Sphingomonas vulcanisoli]